MRKRRGLSGGLSRWIVCVQVLLVCALAGSVAYASSSTSHVPLRLQSGRGARLVRHDSEADPQISAAVRSADGTSLAAWDFKKTYSPLGGYSGDFVEAERFDASAHPVGGAFRVDSGLPAISGYHFEGDWAPKVVYSPTSDSWIVIFQAGYAANKRCVLHSRGRRFIVPCGRKQHVMSIRIDSNGQMPSGPNTVVQQGGRANGGVAAACRAGGCVLVWARCRDAHGAYCVNGYPVDQVALPLDAQGAPAATAPIKISTARCSNTQTNELTPAPPEVAPTSTGYLVSWTDGGSILGSSCVLLRSLSPTGTSIGHEIRVDHRPSGLRPQVAALYHNQQICSYDGGQRALVTWLLGENSNFELQPGRDFQYIGLYRQIYNSKGQLVGRDTRAVRSISDVPPTRGTNGEDPRYHQTLVSDSSQNRCVVLATALNSVDAFAYDPAGQITQSARLLQYRRSTTGALDPFDLVDAVWSGRAGLLLDLHYLGSDASAPATIWGYPLQ